MADKIQHIDDLLRKALGDYTEQPPVGAWEGMESKLEDASPVDHLFSEALSGYTEAPPAGAWADMEARLDDKRKRRRGTAWYWLAAGLVGLLMGGYCLLGDKNTHTTVGHREQVNEMPSAPQQQAMTPVAESAPAVTAPAPITKAPVTETPVQTPQKTPEHQVTTIPQQQQERNNTTQQPVAQKIQQPAPVQQPDVTNNIPDAPVQKQDDQVATQNIPATTNTTASTTDTVKDDIATAMRNRTTPTVMNITKSRYADSMAEIAAKEAAKQQDEVTNIAKDTTPIVASVPAKKEEVKPEVKNIAPAAPDTMDAIVARTLNGTGKVLQSKADAILPASQQIQTPPDGVVFATQDPAADKLAAAFIGPVEDTATYAMDVAVNNYTPDTAVSKTRLQADVLFKVGYERGFDAVNISKFVMAPTVNIKLTNKLGLMLQPAIKIGGVSQRQMNDARSYHAITSSYVDSERVKTGYASVNNVQVETVKDIYYYKQSHDSVVVSHQYDKRTSVEFDLPVMLSYKLLKNVSVYAGPVFNYGNATMVNTNISTYSNVTVRDTIVHYGLGNATPENTMLINEVFTYDTDNITSYNAAAYANSTANKLKMGYTFGASYFVNSKVSVDVSMQQNLSRLNYIPSAGVRNLYKQPYVRFMVGYKLYGNRK